jgi:hypothetical protein
MSLFGDFHVEMWKPQFDRAAAFCTFAIPVRAMLVTSATLSHDSSHASRLR